MNRLRHAYHETVPGLDPYFITGHHDDVLGIFAGYGADVQSRTWRSIVHGFTTVVGMLGVINAALTGVVVGTLAILVLGSGGEAVAFGVGPSSWCLTMSVAWSTRAIAATVADLRPRFPSPGRLTGRRSAGIEAPPAVPGAQAWR